MWALGTFPRLPESRADRTPAARAAALEHSAIGRIGHGLEPVLRPLGFDWRVGTALVGAFAAKEVFVAQMGIVFSLGDAEAHAEGLQRTLRAAYTPLQGLAMLLFCLLSAPCVSTIAVARREMNSWGWALGMLAGMTVIAWIVTFIVYQVGLWLGWGGV